MGKTRAAGWIAGTAVVVIGILAATYFLLYQPRVDETALTMQQVESARSQNDLLEVQVTALAAAAENLQLYEAELDVLELQMPPEVRLAELTDLMDSLAVGNGVTIIQTTPGAAMAVVPPTPVVSQPTTPPPAEGDEGATDAGSATGVGAVTADEAEDAADQRDDTGDGTAAPAPTAPTGPPVIEGFVAVPFMVKVFGAYPNAVSFLDALQRRDERLYLATDVIMKRVKAGPPTQGRPAAVDGDVELQINGYFYVLLDPATAAPEPGEEPTEPPVFPPYDGDNPYVPLVPTQVQSQ